MEVPEILERLIRKFELRAVLDDGDRAAVRALPFEKHAVDAGHYLMREGAVPQTSALLLSGFAYRHKLTADGDRQIMSFHIPGDVIDIEGAVLRVADHNAQTLTRAEIALVPIHRMLELFDRHPRVGRAMWVDTLIDASIYREWVMNVGRRPALQRIGHILCEFACRLDVGGAGIIDKYQLPMTQEQLGDAAGLTPVHVNRTLRQLEASNFIVRHKRAIEIPDWHRLCAMAGFNDRYLHLDQMAA